MMHTRVVLVFGPFAQLARLLKSRTSVHCLTSYFLGSEDSLLFFFFFLLLLFSVSNFDVLQE